MKPVIQKKSATMITASVFAMLCIAVMCALVVLPGCGSKTVEIGIFTTADLQSNVLPYEESVDGETVERGGISKISAVANGLRSEYDGSLLLSSGDDLMGVFYGFFEGKPETVSMSMAAYDVVVPGNHEFNYGTSYYLDTLEYAKYDIVCANLDFKGDKRAEKISNNTIKEVAGIKIGIFGLMTPDLLRISSAGEEISLDSDIERVAENEVAELKEKGADLIIALTHTGKEIDRRVAGSVAGIDIIVGGHDHEFVYETVESPDGETIIVQAGDRGEKLGVLDITYEGGIKNHNWKTITIDENSPSDSEIEEYLAEYASEYEQRLSSPVGETEVDLDATNETVRKKESNLGNLIIDSWMWWFDSTGEEFEIAFMSSGSIRGNCIYPSGTVTYGEIYEIHPFGNTVFQMELTGKQIKQVLEASASAVRIEGDGVPDENRTAYGGFLQIGGLRADFDMTGEPFSAVYDGNDIASVENEGNRLVEARFIDGSEEMPLEEDRKYKVLANAWLSDGGDGHYVFVELEEKTDSTFLITDILIKYITEKSPVAPKNEGRINIAGSR